MPVPTCPVYITPSFPTPTERSPHPIVLFCPTQPCLPILPCAFDSWVGEAQAERLRAATLQAGRCAVTLLMPQLVRYDAGGA